MRFIAIIIIWVVLIGGLKLFLGHRQALVPLQSQIRNQVTGDYRLDLTSTFTAQEDPFALNVDQTESTSAVVIQLGGQDIFPKNKTIEAGKVLNVRDLPDLVLGRNEFYIEVNPPTDQAQKAQAVRLRFFQGDQLMQQKSFWSEPGERLAGTFTVTIAEAHENHDH
jgi:hypothetical protein